MNIVHSPKTWGINTEEFNKLGWGSALGQFKVPNSVLKRFRKDVWQNNTDGTIKDTLEPSDNATDFTQRNIFDAETSIKELAYTYITAIVAMYEILRVTPFGFLEGSIEIDKDGKVSRQPLEGSTQDYLRKVIFNSIEYALLNRQVWEKINGSGITTPNYTVSVDQTNWLLTSDMMGMKAHNMLLASELDEYEWVDEDVFFTTNKKGNIKVLGKVKIEDIPDLAIY